VDGNINGCCAQKHRPQMCPPFGLLNTSQLLFFGSFMFLYIDTSSYIAVADLMLPTLINTKRYTAKLSDNSYEQKR
jgi:hypothetical protein